MRLPVQVQAVLYRKTNTKNIHHYQFMDHFKQENRQRQIKEYAYGVEVSPNEKITISHEHTQHKWCTYKEALKLLKHKENKETLKKLNHILTAQN
jgi:rubrerythrin